MRDERQTTSTFLSELNRSSSQTCATKSYLRFQAQLTVGVVYHRDLDLQARELCVDVQHAILASTYLGVDSYFKNHPIH
jgi:hypothetical protein